jgi:hypothetical protein
MPLALQQETCVRHKGTVRSSEVSKIAQNAFQRHVHSTVEYILFQAASRKEINY